MVFDILRFVYDLAEKRNTFVGLQIPLQQLVGSDQDVPALCTADDLLTFGRGAGHHFDGNTGCKQGEFIFPVKDQRGRRDDERAPVVGGFRLQIFRQQKGDGLQGLAKAHIIGQYTAEAVAVQCFQPEKAGELIGAQYGFQACRRLKGMFFHGFHVPDQFLKGLVSGCCQALLFRKLAVQIEGSVFGQGKGFFPQLRIGQIQIFFDLQQCV